MSNEPAPKDLEVTGKRKQATKIPFMYSFSGNCAVLVQIHIHVSVSDLYIPKIGPHVFCSRIGKSVLGISHRHINLEIGTVAAQFLFLGIFVSDFRYWFIAVYAIVNYGLICGTDT